jgi:hypothetical protein
LQRTYAVPRKSVLQFDDTISCLFHWCRKREFEPANPIGLLGSSTLASHPRHETPR